MTLQEVSLKKGVQTHRCIVVNMPLLMVHSGRQM
jgi:hypothetical protein